MLLASVPLATAFCFVAVNAASMWLSSTSMSTAMLGVPVIGLLMSVVFLGEQLTLTLGIGLLVIISGIFIVTVKPSVSGIKKPQRCQHGQVTLATLYLRDYCRGCNHRAKEVD
ncbi:hypothetical protein [Serratia sp. arafor3]|uniref:EamA domain-containing protein n=2 Tax=Serratia silvae TaxID=2824122 RepID=A0ABT0KC31_9GAMM|nr:hypothetical protein [Serratia silvae]